MDFQDFLDTLSDIPGGWELAGKTFLIVFIALVIDLVQRVVMRRLGARTKSTANPWDDALFDAIPAPASAFIWMMGILLAADLIENYSNAAIFGYINETREIGVIVLLTWFLLRFINNVEANFVEKRIREDRQLDQTAVDAIGKLMRATVVITAVLVLLQTLGVSIAGLLAFGGVGGIAVGFAAKDMLANFFGGMTIYLDKPFKVGDWVRSPEKEIEGTVERIGWRSTRIRTFDQRPMYVPNSVFSNIVVENPSRMFARRIYEIIGIRYADFEKMETVVNEVRSLLESHEGIAQERTLMVNFDKFGESSLNFFVYCFTRTKVWAEYHEVKQDVLLEIGRIIERHGAEIALPTRTLRMPGGLAIEQAQPPAERGR